MLAIGRGRQRLDQLNVGNLGVRHPPHQLARRHRFERALAGDQLVQTQPGRIQIAAAIDHAVFRLLGRHVEKLAQNDAGVGLRRVEGRLGEAEVDHLHLALVRDEHVLRAHIAVHQADLVFVVVALAVRVGERVEHPAHHVQHEGQRQRHVSLAHPGRHFAQVFAVDVLEREVRLVRVQAHVEHLRDGSVRELHQRLGFVDEPLDEVGVLREVRQNLLDDAELLEPLGAFESGQKNLAHAAGRERQQQGVPTEGYRLEGPQAPAGLWLLAHGF